MRAHAGKGIAAANDHEMVGEEVAALEPGKLAAASPGEQRQADQGAKSPEVPGGLPQLPNLIIAQGAATLLAALSPLGARALGLAQAGEDVVAGAPRAHAPFQEGASELAQVLCCARRAGWNAWVTFVISPAEQTPSTPPRRMITK